MIVYIVLWIYIYCAVDVHLLCCGCTFIVLWMYIYCAVDVHLLCCGCTFIVLLMYIYCVVDRCTDTIWIVSGRCAA